MVCAVPVVKAFEFPAKAMHFNADEGIPLLAIIAGPAENFRGNAEFFNLNGTPAESLFTEVIEEPCKRGSAQKFPGMEDSLQFCALIRKIDVNTRNHGFPANGKITAAGSLRP